jgi:hypothetical protein
MSEQPDPVERASSSHRPRWKPGDFQALPRLVSRDEPRLEAILDTARRALGSGFGDLLAGDETHETKAKIAAAVYEAIRCDTDIRYDWEVANSGEPEQVVRLTGEVLERRVGTCLELALLYAAVLEQAHLSPAIVILDTGAGWHALAGYFVEPIANGSVVEDAVQIRQLVEAGNLVLIETAGFALRRGQKRDYQVAREEACQIIEKTTPLALVDVLSFRSRGCLPAVRGVNPGGPTGQDTSLRVPQFDYGGVVPPDRFIDREHELAEAEAMIRKGQSFLLVGNRRAGKTSFCDMLIHQMMGKKGNQILATKLDLRTCRNLTSETFLEHTVLSMAGEIARQVFECKSWIFSSLQTPKHIQEKLRSDHSFEEFFNLYRHIIDRTHSHEGHTPSPLLRHEFAGFTKDLLQIMREEGWARFVIFYDEANKLPEDVSVDLLASNEEALKAVKVSSVYAASPEMADSFEQLSRSFEPHLLLGPFPRINDMMRLLARYYFDSLEKVDDSCLERLPVTEEAVQAMWKFSGGRPYPIQVLAKESFRRAAAEAARIVSEMHVASSYRTLKTERERAQYFPDEKQ